ncbi:anaphase-promoting complex subunit 2 [Erpetoichthys calabaricus]|uniref:anaphase-promoting complex subunit 2 n=1 Tax=Erpetoichthys calabaricus TaxID=27687 RepID=UPI002234A377|nr:anaphase-promoting complex subunit 2 [Erpetoichthys calabaricus]
MASWTPEVMAAWSTLSSGLVPISAHWKMDQKVLDIPVTRDAMLYALEVLTDGGAAGILEDWFIEVFQVDLQRNISPEFWSSLEQPENGLSEKQRAGLLLGAFRTLKARLEPYLQGLALLVVWKGAEGSFLKERVFTLLRAILFFLPSQAFKDSVQEFYSCTFRVYMWLYCQEKPWGKKEDRVMKGAQDSTLAVEEASEEEEEEVARVEEEAEEVTPGKNRGAPGLDDCPGCSVHKEHCWCHEAMEQQAELSQILHNLQLVERVCSDAVTTVLYKMMEQRMEKTCRGEFDRPFLSEFHEWLTKVINWLSKVFLSPAEAGSPLLSENATLKHWGYHVHYFFYRIFVNMRIGELFSIIRDFPESKPAVEELKFCLEQTNQRPQLLTSLKAELETRLLHPGVLTSDIITLYISAIMALRELDPSMVILQVACEPIRKYLRTREDTVRQIVAGLTGDAESSSDLANELSKADPVTLEHSQDSDEEVDSPEKWQPDPIDAQTDKSGSKRRSSDIISLLVSIYGSKDLFIDEYQTMLADRLIHQFNYCTAREIRNVELLKLRFGESYMHFCEVMLKDVVDSRRINTNIHDEEAKLPEDQQPKFPLNGMILSSEFWPTLKEEKLELPPAIREVMDAYTKRYEKLKAMRTLSWKPHLGSVTLDLELADRTMSNLSVSPMHAAIILHFQDKNTWTLEELSDALKVPSTMLRRKMAFWQQQGVLREESPGVYVVIEEMQCEKTEKNVVLLDSDEEGESNMATQSEQREEKLQLFWAYIQAMLTNLETMTLERIHTMLKMFVTMGPTVTEMDIQELQSFLQKKVRNHELLCSGGTYRLPKSPN